jgi:two-component system chemotaxis response regulator CheY
MLRDLGFEVADAVHGRDGLAKLAAGPAPDVILVDWNMPEMDGLEFIQHVRRDARYQDTPLMMVTSETEVERMSLALAAGATEYVMKPFDRDVIVGKLGLLGMTA